MKLLALLSITLFLTGCAYIAPVAAPSEPGFWLGLLHGFICFFTAILAFFTDIEMYASPNSGGFYNLGFMLGAMLFFGGGAKVR